MENLQQQINTASKSVFTDSYSMSIGEIISMYKEKEIEVHPEFQRAFRWDINQKSTLIESILLGIPMPPIFIFHREDGVWDVIDGQQRLSTIFQFVGVYRDENDEIQPKIKLVKTKFLCALEKISWEDESAEVYQLTPAQRLLIKRAKLDVKILKSTSDSSAKYDLFQRLNAGGSHLTAQEVRTCLIIMESQDFYQHLDSMAKNLDFKETLPLTERAVRQQENLEFVVRFIAARHVDTANMPSSLHEHLDNSIIKLIRDETFNINEEVEVFNQTFKCLNNLLGGDCFKRYNATKQVFEGPTTISAFEAMAPAISKNLRYYENISAVDFKTKVISMHTNCNYAQASTKRSTERFKSLLQIGEEVFNGNTNTDV